MTIPRRDTGLYLNPDTGRVVSTHSMLKTFRRCPKQTEFKYDMRLKRRLIGSPLKRGTWVHTLLELFHGEEDWEAEHKKLSSKFDEMFDEEKDHYGDLPREIMTIMRSYIWHYQQDPWKVLETEFTIETEWPDGSIYRGKVDALIENQFGLWLVDHKTHKTLPDFNFRLLDAQSGLYLWAALKNKIPVKGFIWNYLRWKAPSVPDLVYKNTRLSKRALDTDYPTFTRAVQKYRRDHGDTFKVTADVVAKQRSLKAQQYRPGEPQTSTFFRRDILEKDIDMLKEVAREAYRTHQRMNDYDFEAPGVERVVERSCTFMCSYTDICTAQLMGGNIMPILKQNYIVGDPNDYYNDRAGEDRDKE